MYCQPLDRDAIAMRVCVGCRDADDRPVLLLFCNHQSDADADSAWSDERSVQQLAKLMLHLCTTCSCTPALR